jgi:hypothetical protein
MPKAKRHENKEARNMVRRITNGGRKNIGKFPSLKNGRAVWYESLLERDFMHLLEADPDVISYKEQPFKIRYALNGKIHLYTPDLLVARRLKRQIAEVKPEVEAVTEEFQQLIRCVAPICGKDGYEYLVMTEKQIRMQPRLKNIKLLQKYSRARVNYKAQLDAYAFFAKRKEAALNEVFDYFAYTGAAKNIVYALIYWGVLSIDLNRAISPNSIVRLSAAVGIKEKSA